MTKITTYHRTSGVLAHITSLPSPFGIGDLGLGTYEFLEFLEKSGQSIWQILPLGPTDAAFSNSPYMSVSAFAGNPLLISPEILYKDGLLGKTIIDEIPPYSPYSVDYDKILLFKNKLLQEAYTSFKPTDFKEFDKFREESVWLSDYCLFMSFKKAFPEKAWYQWDKDLIHHKKNTIEKARKKFKDDIHYYQFEQFIFFHQWQKIREHAKNLGIQIFGDIPIYVSLDSADVWANQKIFQLDEETCLPTHVAGVPPDYFSETGQKWGNPLYHWNSDKKEISDHLMSWWISRFEHVFKHHDIARIDHFRGFESFWSVPAQHKTAMKGKWIKGPGAQFFQEISTELGSLKIVAEDLGEITDKVIQLREKLGFPGMKILQFAFDGNVENSYLPFNYESPNFFVYTGTHDNDTTVGWFFDSKLDDDIRRKVKLMANRDSHDKNGIHKDLIYLAMSSTAVVSITPLQDILGFGNDCRMNTPGTASGNWVWRCSKEFLTDELSLWLKNTTERFGRARKPPVNDTSVSQN